MSEGLPAVRATEGPASAEEANLDAIDDRYNRAYDGLAESAGDIRQHICLHPLHVDVSAAFLESARRLALAHDEFERASEAIEEGVFGRTDIERAKLAILEGDPQVNFVPEYLAGFRAGARAQAVAAERYLAGRGWVKLASALALVPVLEAPERTTSVVGGADVPA